MHTGMLLWAALITLLARKASTQAIEGCFLDTSCSSSVTEGNFADAESCCIADSPMAFRPVGGECTPCVVIGWQMNELTLEETGIPTNLAVAVVKGTPPASVYRFRVENEPGTATNFDDYTPHPPGPGGIVRVTLQVGMTPPEIRVSARGDQISQEGTEDFTLVLISVGPPPTGVFVRRRLTALIIDRTVVGIQWTETDYTSLERDGILTARIRTLNEIAGPITVNIIPLTYTQLQNLGEPLPPAANLQVAASENDFDVTVQTATLPAGTVAIDQLVITVDVTDDLRDEVNEEQFVLLLTLNSAEFPDLVSFGSGRVTLCRLIDNDATVIGFELPRYEYFEQDTNSPQTIRLVKETLSDLTVSVQVSISTTETPPDATQAISGSDYSLVEPLVYVFRPEDEFRDVDLTILPDLNVEMIEGFVLNVIQADGSLLVIPGTNPSTQVYIFDNDDVVVGFSQTMYEEDEDVGSVTVCARVFQPPPGGIPTGVTFTVLLDTSPGTADPTDFAGVSQIPLTFSSTDREVCHTITITVDTTLELDESFTATLSRPNPAPDFPTLTIDPAEAMIVIENDDVVVFEFEPVDYPVNEGSMADIIVVLRGSSVIPVSVEFNTADGTAIAPDDYVAVSGMVLTFSPGESSQTVQVETRTDGQAEDEEQFTAFLSGPSEGGVVGDADVATVTITDSTAVRVELAADTITVLESDLLAVFTINKLTTTSRTVSVLFSTQSGTALEC